MSKMDFNDDLHVTIAMLEDGNTVHYDMASQSHLGPNGVYNPDNYALIGRGTIYSVDGVVQTVSKVYYFYKRLK